MLKLTSQTLLLFAAAGINLRPEASEMEIEAAVKTVVDANAALKVLNASIKAENDGFKAQVANAEKVKVTALVDAAIAEKKITEDMRATYTTLATASFESAKAALDKMPGYRKITDQLGGGGEQS